MQRPLNMVKAPAKVNLILEVLEKRQDGYHQISSILQAIDLCDELIFEEGKGVEVRYEPLLKPEGDLVLRAANLLRKATACTKGALIRVRKAIPLASGLGGGSSDAAAALKGLNQLWNLGLAKEELASLAGELGSDAPFFIYGGSALAQGRGELITPLPSLPPHWLVLFLPPLPVPQNKTQQVYSLLRPSSYSQGEYSRKLVEKVKAGETLSDCLFFNALDGAAFAAFPKLQDYWALFMAAGANRVHLTGSGPSLFAWEEGRERAEAIYSTLTRKGLRAWLAQTQGNE